MRRLIWASGIFLALLLMFLLFYRPKPLAVRQELEAESELHKVKRITNRQVEAEALRLGDSLITAADSLLRVRLTTAFSQNQEIKAALAQYPPQHYPEVQAAAKKYGITLTRNAETSPPAAQPNGQIKVASQTEMLFTKPIFISDASCLRCHGEVDSDISAPDLAGLKKAYPNYKLTGYENGQRIGTWTLTFYRAPLLQKLSRQRRKSLRPR
jgi:cytochrome c553